MQDSLKPILSIQELDVKMVRLIRLKRQRQNELKQIELLRAELVAQLDEKEQEIKGLNDECGLYEQKISEHKERIKKLETQQTSIKKIDEFNALTKEITLLERERAGFEQTLSNLVDKKNTEEEVYEKTKETLAESDKSSTDLEKDIKETIGKINQEGSELKKERDALAKNAEPEVLSIYERLFSNKKDRVVVPLENRNCTGCHIALTAQHENLVRKGEKLVFCEHCSRIHFWSEAKADDDGEAGPTKRRRRRASVAN